LERNAAKRAPGQAGAGAAAGAAAALANVNVNVSPVGDWTTQAENPELLFQELGAEIVERKAAQGDRAAQFTQGCRLMSDAAGADGAGLSGAAGRSTQVKVGLAQECTFWSPTKPICVDETVT
jgi:hypothetical protein